VTTELIDISMPLSERTPAWPDSPGVAVRPLKSIDRGAEANVSQLRADIHAGTHLDAPSHMISDGATIDEYPLARGLGEAVVIDTGEAREIDDELLAAAVPDGTRRVLLRTRNSRGPGPEASFHSDFAALTLTGARWLVERGVELVGIDYLSIQRFGDPLDTHLVLFDGGVTILEGLWLAEAQPGRYELVCLPLKLPGCEGAPARAVLRLLDG
jgi:arylformamidase